MRLIWCEGFVVMTATERRGEGEKEARERGGKKVLLDVLESVLIEYILLYV